MRSPALRYARANFGITFRPDANTALWLLGQDDAYSAVIRDRSGNGNDGTITGATWTRLPSGLWGLDFDGSVNAVTFGTEVTFASTDFTVELWGSFDYANSDAWGVIIGNWAGGATHGWRLGRWGSDSAIRAIVSNDVAQQSAIFTLADTDIHHIVMTLKGTTLSAYTDAGTPVTNASAFQVAASVGVTMRMGAAPGGTDSSNFKLTGYLPRLHTRALSAEEVSSYYNQERHLFGV